MKTRSALGAFLAGCKNPELFAVGCKEVASIAGVHPHTVSEWVVSGLLRPALRLNARVLLFDRQKVERMKSVAVPRR